MTLLPTGFEPGCRGTHFMKSSDEMWMKRALSEAEKGIGTTSPNPLVGALIVKEGKVISSAYHAVFGGPHAEAAALEKAGLRAKGGTLYVTLEPCSSWGKTPPCTDAVIRAGIKRVVAAMPDPNPLNHRQGFTLLRRAGIRVETGILKDEAERQNAGFITWIRKGRPYVTLKMAQSLDGKIAGNTGKSRWITGPEARRYVHRLRARQDAILVGMNTAAYDNPSLTVRLGGAGRLKHTPWRIVLDSRWELLSDSKVFQGDSLTLRVVSEKHLHEKKIRKSGGNIPEIILPAKTVKKRIDLHDLMKKLAGLGITRLLVEGGGETAASLIEARLADKVMFFIAPKIIGGRSSVTSVEGQGVDHPYNAISLKNAACTPLGRDWLFEGEL